MHATKGCELKKADPFVLTIDGSLSMWVTVLDAKGHTVGMVQTMDIRTGQYYVLDDEQPRQAGSVRISYDDS